MEVNVPFKIEPKIINCLNFTWNIQDVFKENLKKFYGTQKKSWRNGIVGHSPG